MRSTTDRTHPYPYKPTLLPSGHCSYILLIIFSLVAILPFALIVNTSLKAKSDIIQKSHLALPTVLHFENFVKAWNEGIFLSIIKIV